MNVRRGFTLIELLVVIAIIGILAAITFPVFTRAKDSGYRSSDISNMNQIRSALELYKQDQGAFPPALLGYATGYSNFTPSDSDIIPANLVAGALYPKRINSLEILRPAYDRGGTEASKLFTMAKWPNKVAAGAGDDEKAFQRFGPMDRPVSRCVDTSLVTNYYYNISGYDVAPAGPPSAGPGNELRYTLFWTGYSVPSSCNPVDAVGSGNDNPRQLGYTDPPDTTVITWNSFFRDWSNGVPERSGKRDLVLFLGGGAKPNDSREVFEKSWQVNP